MPHDLITAYPLPLTEAASPRDQTLIRSHPCSFVSGTAILSAGVPDSRGFRRTSRACTVSATRVFAAFRFRHVGARAGDDAFARLGRSLQRFPRGEDPAGGSPCFPNARVLRITTEFGQGSSHAGRLLPLGHYPSDSVRMDHASGSGSVIHLGVLPSPSSSQYLTCKTTNFLPS